MSSIPLPKVFVQRTCDLQARAPHFKARVRFLPSGEGARKSPVPNGFGCPCKLSKDTIKANDARLLFEEDWVELGEEVVAGFFFLFGDDAARPFQDAGRFFLWEAGIVGEAIVL